MTEGSDAGKEEDEQRRRRGPPQTRVSLWGGEEEK